MTSSEDESKSRLWLAEIAGRPPGVEIRPRDVSLKTELLQVGGSFNYLLVVKSPAPKRGICDNGQRAFLVWSVDAQGAIFHDFIISFLKVLIKR